MPYEILSIIIKNVIRFAIQKFHLNHSNLLFMRKLFASINNQTLVDRPELIACLRDLQAKVAAFDQLKAQKKAQRIQRNA